MAGTCCLELGIEADKRWQEWLIEVDEEEKCHDYRFGLYAFAVVEL
jgi:hypothetical protein